MATSDVHVDYAQSQEWVSGLSLSDYQDDILIVAGDISDRPDSVSRTFDQFKRRFSEVLYVPGNHELWVRRCKTTCSYSKFHLIQRLADQSGVRMSPYQADGVSIVPLLGWYDYSFGQPEQSLLDSWMDFRFCNWLDHSVEEVTQYFTQLNEANLHSDSELIISFSHFLPRIDTMPKGIPARFRYIYPVLGSSVLERQIEVLGSHVHVYGHSHVNVEIELDGRLYVNCAYGNPAESHISAKALHCVHQS